MRKILVVIDMQNDFIDGTLGSQEAVSIVPNVIEKIQAYQQDGNDVYFTQDTHMEDYLQTQEGKNLPVLHCIKGTTGWALHSSINQLAEKIQAGKKHPIIFEKGIFGGENLAQVLRNLIDEPSTTEIELIGLCTDICVLSNAILFKTYLPEVLIKVDAACCAGVTPTTHHNALEAMKMCQIQVMNEKL